MGFSSTRHDCGWRKGRGAESSTRRVLHSRATCTGVRSQGQVPSGLGGPGQGYEWFSSEHRIFVDYKNNVWLSGNAKEDNHVLKFTTKGKLLLQIGHAGKNQGSNDTGNLGGPAGLFVYPKTNELFVD